MIGEKLADDEVTGDKVDTNVFPNSFRIYGCPRLAQRFFGASSMVAPWWHTVVLQPSPVMAWLGEHGYDIYKP